MKESEEDRLKCVVYESTRAPLTRSPFPKGEGYDTRIPLFSTQRLSQGGKQRGGGFAAKKGSQPRLATLGSPFQGKGLAWSLPPSFGRRCPKGRRLDMGSGMKESEGDRLKYAVCESTLSTAARSPFPNGEGCDTRMPLFSTQHLSQGGRQRGGGFAAQKGSQPRLAALGSPFQGKERRLDGKSGMKESEGDHLKYAVCESTLSTADAVPLPQWGRLRYEDTAFLASSKRIQDTWRKRITTDKAFPAWGRWRAKRAG